MTRNSCREYIHEILKEYEKEEEENNKNIKEKKVTEKKEKLFVRTGTASKSFQKYFDNIRIMCV